MSRSSLNHHGPETVIRFLALTVLLIVTLWSWPTTAADLTDLLSTGDAPVETTSGTIDVSADASSDENIRKRLDGIYSELDSLGAIDVSVTSGIVTLGGTVTSSQSGTHVVDIARQVDGVIEVLDEMSIDTSVGRRVQSTLDHLRSMFVSLIAGLPIFVLALLVVAAFWYAGRWAGARRGLFETLAPNVFIADLLALISRALVVLAGLIVALTLLDATSLLGSVLGAAGIVGLAIGFAVRDTVENFIASILLSLRAPFMTHDYVRIGSHEGTVARLTSRATVLISGDGNHLRIPNAEVYKAVIVNFTRKPERRFEFLIGVDTDLDLNDAQQTALDTIYKVPGVLSEPSAAVLVTELGDSNVTLTVRAWVDQRKSDLMKVRSEAIRQVKQAFDEAGIAMPEPIYRLRFQGTPTAMAALSEAAVIHPAETVKVPDGPLPQVPEGRQHEDRIADSTAADTSPETAVRQSIERELSESDARNLLNTGSRPE